MDPFVQNQLVEWDLISLQGAFEANQIDEESFNSLTNDDIKELIPILGMRKKFLQKYNVYIKIAHVSKVPNIETDTASDSSEVEVHKVPTVNKQTSFLGLQDFSRACGNNFDINLKKILLTSPHGKSVLKFYGKNKCLDDTHRSRLVDVIIKHLYDYITQHRLKHDQYIYLCKQIILEFPTEIQSTYYIPYVPKRETANGKCIYARGRLVDKIRNLLHLSGDTVKVRKAKVVEEATTSGENLDDEQVEEAIIFLKHYTEPWAEVQQKWEYTAPYRFNKNTTKESTVTQFLNEWPILSDIRAEQLINLDFEYLFKNKLFKLLENWHTFFDSVIKSSDITKIRDKDIRNVIETLGSEISEDTNILHQLRILAHIFPPKGRSRIGSSEHWKFSTAECIESIVVVVKDPGLIEETLQELKEKAYLKKIQVQPFLLLVVNKDIETTFVIIDTIRYQTSGVLKGLDLLFKIFHVFNANYPRPSEHLWTLIQKCIYQINTPYDKEFPNIMHIINLFNNK